jgi:hypothetical protein
MEQNQTSNELTKMESIKLFLDEVEFQLSSRLIEALQKWSITELFSNDLSDYPIEFQPSPELLEARFELWDECNNIEREWRLRMWQKRQQAYGSKLLEKSPKNDPQRRSHYHTDRSW